jgi:ABC-type glutathione transport system ATPase component
LEENLKKYWDRIQIQRPWQDCLQSYPHEFSGGELQRLGFLRAIMASPDLLLLDEPVSALDPMNKKEITKIFVDWQYESGGSVVIVSHDPELTEPFCSRVLHLEQGRLKESQ